LQLEAQTRSDFPNKWKKVDSNFKRNIGYSSVLAKHSAVIRALYTLKEILDPDKTRVVDTSIGTDDER
jgi:hypothetical protein